VAIWFYIVFGIVALVAGAAFTRWFFMRPKTARLPQDLIDQVNRYEEEFQRFNANVVELHNLLKGQARQQWQSRNSEILRTLRKINRLLQRLNDFYEELTLSHYRAGLRKKLSEMGVDGSISAFMSSDEKERIMKLGKLSEEEIKNADWDELLKRL